MKRFRISEKARTVVLLVLLAIALAVVFYIQTGIDTNFTDQL